MSVENNESCEHEKPEKFSKGKAIISSATSCPPTPPITTMTSLVLVVALIYGSLWGLTDEEALPGGPIFGLFVLVVICYVGGQFIRLFRVPTLVGMMVGGFILRNVPHINIAKDIPESWGGTIRNMALILILLRAGLEVDANILLNNKSTCSKLIFMPFIAELCLASVAAHYLFEMPWKWSFLMGAMLSAVSPAVVLPVMLKLQKKGIGTTNGVPTMVIVVAGVVDVLSLTAFEVVLGVTFPSGSLSWTIAKGPVEIVSGIIYGVLLGVIAWYIPNPQEKSKSIFRFMIVLFGAMFVLFGSALVDFGAAGALGCICLPFVAALRWKDDEDWDEHHNPVGEALSFVWRIIEPFLFGLIGSEIRIEYLQPSTVGLGIAIMFIGIASRMLAAMLAAFSAGLTLKEQIFITFAGLPKATVQAAIGPIALAKVRELNMDSVHIQYGIEILTCAVLAILITAPLGATIIAFLAPRLLERDDKAGGGDKHKPEVADTTIPMYETQPSYNSFYTKDDNKHPNIAIESNHHIYTVEKL